ncbi:hypothetical protein EZV62_019168 [Acer yangbiense]|uniref:Uncharacterized protein n=1 Tax=Acer yangbiense TaxID=1000413 RepID=A0A5C7HBK2_9ROSI|nr:hypothetical protein EZV62_019168 [Acer yangbiense]
MLERQLTVVTTTLAVVEREAASKDRFIRKLKEELEGKDNAIACAMAKLELRVVEKFKRSHAYDATIMIVGLMQCGDVNGAKEVIYYFEVFNNNLSGTIPAQVGALSKLNHLDLGYNHFTGAIPPEIWNLRNLTRLFLDGNELTGHIPPTLGHLTKLETLYLSANRLTGPIPSTLC